MPKASDSRMTRAQGDANDDTGASDTANALEAAPKADAAVAKAMEAAPVGPPAKASEPDTESSDVPAEITTAVRNTTKTGKNKNISAAPPAYPHVKWIERFPLSAWTTAIDSIEKKLSTAQRLSKAMVTKGTPMPLAIPKPQSYVCSPKFQETRDRSRSPRRSRSNACMVRASVQSVSVMAASII